MTTRALTPKRIAPWYDINTNNASINPLNKIVRAQDPLNANIDGVILDAWVKFYCKDNSGMFEQNEKEVIFNPLQCCMTINFKLLISWKTSKMED
jgi:hypothetical protein